jgi:hypothetical protein
MNNNLLQLKIKQRLNKLASMDYDNIETWQIQEAFNKAQIEWVRRQVHGNNATKEGDEQTRQRIDDLQILLKTYKLEGKMYPTYFESDLMPIDYMSFKRVSVKAVSECCPEERVMDIYLAEEADADLIMTDNLKGPSFEWAESFCTLFGKKVRIYKTQDYTYTYPRLIYYRFPRDVEFLNSVNPENGKIYTANVTCEFKEDITEILIDEAAAILAGDIEASSQYQRGTQNAERNN